MEEKKRGESVISGRVRRGEKDVKKKRGKDEDSKEGRGNNLEKGSNTNHERER